MASERSGDRVPVGARFSSPVRVGPASHPASFKTATMSFSWGLTGQVVALTILPHLEPMLKKR